MVLIGFGALVAIQLIRPARTNPAVEPSHTIEATTPVPQQIDSILRRSCFDCHSNLTRWPWYSNVAPVSWFVIHHVDKARSRMNFSEWPRPGSNNAADSADQLRSICRQVQRREMPLSSYLLLHPAAGLSAGDIESVCQWTASASRSEMSRQ